MSQGGGGNSAGPTGVPWVDSNGWQMRLADVREPGKAVWVDTQIPKEKRVVSSTAYLLAIADAAMYGGRWIINLDADFKPDTWKPMMAALRFFAAHKLWKDYRARAVVGILSDFQGANEFTGGELLNLTARQNQPYRILAGGESWQGLKAILYANVEAPPADMRGKLLAFAQSGGLVITGGAWAAAEVRPPTRIRATTSAAWARAASPQAIFPIPFRPRRTRRSCSAIATI